MKIIKHGKKANDSDKKLRGKCDSCGCVVECIKGEIKWTMDDRDGDYYWVLCPECSHHIYFDEKDME